MDEKWGRREEDRKSRADISRAIEKLEGKIDQRFEALAERVNELDDFLRGGTNNQDPLGTRVHLVETGLTELRVLVKGDALGRGSLIEIAKQASKDAEEARRIATGKAEARVTLRGQNVSVIVAAISLIGVLTMAALTNWDKVRLSLRPETPDQKLERIQREIEQEKKIRGVEIQKKLREIERAARIRP